MLSQLAAWPAPSALDSLTCRQRHWLTLIFKAHPALQRLLLNAQYLDRDGRHLAIREKPERRQLISSVYRARGVDPLILVLLKLIFSHRLWSAFFGNKVSRWCTCLNGHVRTDQCCSSLRSMMTARARLYRAVFFTLYAWEVQFITRQ